MNLEKIQEKYQKYYKEIHYRGNTGKATNFYHRALEKDAKKRFFSNVLEVGAGTGEHLEFVLHDFKNYFLTDLNLPNPSIKQEELISKLKNHNRNLYLEIQNVEKLTYEDSSFDRVISTCLLHHVQSPVKALQEMRRVTGNNGIISIYLPSDPGFLYRLTQFLVSTRSLKKYFTLSEIKYLRANEHRNHVASISGLISGVFADDKIKINSFPKINFGWNTRLFQTYTIQVQK
jgi:ubiquinone/menaquinone biosynthesis C-methylase UbiE